MATLAGVVGGISILPIVPLWPGLRLWDGLLGAHLGIHRGGGRGAQWKCATNSKLML